MTVSLAIYGVLVGSFLAGATFFLDRTARALRVPARWIWVVGMMGVTAAPILPGLFQTLRSEPGTSGAIPVDLLYYLAMPDNIQVQVSGARAPFLDQPFLLLWILASLAILGAVLWTSLRLNRSARSWARRTMGESDVLISDGLGPAVFGLFRPRIVLPPWTLELDREKLRMVLIHEKEHQQARDPAVLTLGLLLAILTPWNPAIWWMARRLHLAVEGDCDGRVLARGVSPTRYGNLLLEVAAGTRGLSALAPALAEGGQTTLERRLLMIRSNVRKHSAGSAIFAAFLGGGLILLACETPTPPSESEEAVVLSSAPLEQAEDPVLLESGPLKGVVETAAEDGYYLVRKDGGNVEVVRPVEAGELKLVSEGSGETPTAFVVKEKGGGGGVIKLIPTNEGEPGGEELKPLIIVDGVILADGSGLEDLDKNNIASVNVIKGAAAEEQYGERAKGGVIQITTKG